eukprot:1138376-Pelagomonas_calceolata.AAC.3
MQIRWHRCISSKLLSGDAGHRRLKRMQGHSRSLNSQRHPLTELSMIVSGSIPGHIHCFATRTILPTHERLLNVEMSWPAPPSLHAYPCNCNVNAEGESTETKFEHATFLSKASASKMGFKQHLHMIFKSYHSWVHQN